MDKNLWHNQRILVNNKKLIIDTTANSKNITLRISKNMTLSKKSQRRKAYFISSFKWKAKTDKSNL